MPHERLFSNLNKPNRSRRMGDRLHHPTEPQRAHDHLRSQHAPTRAIVAITVQIAILRGTREPRVLRRSASVAHSRRCSLFACRRNGFSSGNAGHELAKGLAGKVGALFDQLARGLCRRLLWLRCVSDLRGMRIDFHTYFSKGWLTKHQHYKGVYRT